MSLNEIKKQMNSISKTAQITNAMRLVSTTKYNRIVIESKNYELYRQKVRYIVSQVVNAQPNIGSSYSVSSNLQDPEAYDVHDMLQVRPINKVGFLVIASDKGLAGNYNSSLLKKFKEVLTHYNKQQIEVLAIGEPVVKFCKENDYHVIYERYDLSDYPSFTEVQTIIRKAVELFRQKVYDQLYICHNHAVNILTVDFKMEQILPLVHLDFDDVETDELGSDFIFEPSLPDVLDVLLPLYTETQIYGGIIDAKTAEQSSRMQAMGQATDNANDLIADLQQEYHHERQKRITNEIIEITNGANAQKIERRL